MPNIMNQELVRAFNIILCHNEVAITNLTVQSTDQTFFKKEDRIVISFDKTMGAGQCMKYLHNIKKSIVETFCGSESGANMSFNTQFFPFNFNERQLTKDKEGYKFSVPIDKGVVFNLKCLLANGLARDVTGAMGRDFGLEHVEEYTSDESFDRKSYLYCMRFYDKRLQEYFIESFSATVKGYKNSPKSTDDFLKIKDNCLYIKGSIFNKAEFIKDIVKHKASLECRDFEVTSAEDETVESLKFPVIDLFRKVGIPINSVLHVSYTGSGENSVLIPAAKEVIDNIIYYKFLSKEQADDINKVFGITVLNNVEDCTSPQHLPVFGRRGIYGIDFANQDISYCVLNKIMESSVINAKHELAIDPELPRTLLAEPSPKQEFPKRSRGEGLEKHPRRRSKKEEETGRLFRVLREEIGQASTSSQQTDMPSSSYTYIDKRDESMPEDSYFLPSMLTSFPHVITPLVHYGIPTRPTVLTTRHDPMFPNHEFFARSSCFEDMNILSMKSEEHDKSEQGACSQVGVRALEGAQADDESMTIEIRGEQVSYRPSLTPFPTAWDNSMSLNFGVSEDSPEDTENICNEEHKEQKVTKEKEEEKLFKALLYWFNLNNYALDPPHTNFIVKNGKIASLIDDGVDVKEYLQEIIDKTKEEYRVNKEEAYDFNEFPFQFLSNCEKNQETTVVANISRGALLNLKELFSREHEGKVEIKDIDINIVEKTVKSEKDKWVNFQVQEHGLSPKKAIKTCYPDESVLEYISITKDKGGYWINRDYDGSEVELFRGERWPAKDKSKAEKMKSEDNKDSGISSAEATDAEKVSSKAEATTSSGYESMDCENTREGSPKRRSQSPVGEGNPRKSPKRGSSPLSRLESLSLSSSSHQIGKY